MSLRGSIERMKEHFETQFEVAEDGRLLYRRNQKGAPIPVSAQEHDLFVREYLRAIYWIIGGMMAAIVIFVGLAVWWIVATETDLPETWMTIGMISISVAAIASMYWVQAAPSRELGHRASFGLERTRDEMRTIRFSKISYGQLGAAAIGGAVLPFTIRSDQDVLNGWGRLWLVFGGVIILVAIVQAARKWHFEKERRSGL